MDSQKLEIGQIITSEQEKDAIHIAVAPVIASHRILPGYHIGLVRPGQASSRVESKIGVADPFLKLPIQKGERFWIFLYPQTITGLRHLWSHPAFQEDVQPKEETAKEKAEAWLRDFAESVGADYQEMLYVAESHCGESKWGGNYLCEGGRWEGYGTPPEFWDHYEALTGKRPNSEFGLPGIFSCAC